MKNALIIFYRNPSLGNVKTRLAKTVGDEKALHIYLKLSAYTREITENLQVDKFLFYSDDIDTKDAWDNNTFQKQSQTPGADLGTKMRDAFHQVLDLGYQSVCLIGTDCLEINEDTLLLAFKELKSHSVVIGPARDGGYYLLGMNTLYPELFQDKEWGNFTVFSDTLEDLQKNHIDYHLLPILNDIDEERDLPKELRS